MTFGRFLIYCLFFLNIGTFLLYIISIGGSESWRKAGRAVQIIKALLAGLAFFYLGTLFVHDQFGFTYVRDNSARAQELIYKISALWAGQEGTFLLWLLLLSVVGLVLSFRLKDLESHSMLFIAVMEITICALLMKSDPFALVSGGVPDDGSGMNALLKNPWMAIHPPVVFLGYALTAAPFAIFLGGVLKGDVSWNKRVRAWAVASWGILGIGIFLGSFWAYEVLGWGGYWGWDPVENASLFPWIALGALVHGLFLQNYNKGVKIWNGAMVCASYLLVLLSAFLTRSGILNNFSQHSFQGGELYAPLLFVLLTILAISVVMFIVSIFQNKKASEANVADKSSINRSFLSVTIVLFWIFFLFIFTGTNFPIISSWLNQNGSSINLKYYNVTSTLVAIPFSIVLLLCPLFFTRKGGKGISLAAGVLVALVATAICWMHGVKNPWLLLLAFSGGVATATNFAPFVRYLFARKMNFAAYLAHIGVAVILIGFVLSSAGTKTKHIVIQPGQSVGFAGSEYSLLELGQYEFGYTAKIGVEGKRNRKINMNFVADEAQGMAINKPVKINGIDGDLYLSPNQILFSDDNVSGNSGKTGTVSVKMGETVKAGSAEVTFEKYDTAKMQQGIVGIVLKVKSAKVTGEIVPELRMTDEGMMTREVSLEGSDLFFGIEKINVESKEALISWHEGAKTSAAKAEVVPSVIFQASYKPYIWLVWLGMTLISVGSLLAMFRWIGKSGKATI